MGMYYPSDKRGPAPANYEGDVSRTKIVSLVALIGTIGGWVIAFAPKVAQFVRGASKVKEIPEYFSPEIDANDATAALYERMYFETLETRERLVARLQVPLAVVLSLVGAQSYMILATDFTKVGWVFWVYAAFLVVAFLMISRTAQHFFGVLSGHSYRFIPTPSDFEDFRIRSIKEFSGKSPENEWLEHWTSVTLRREVLKHMITCASYNALRNDVRSGQSWRGHVLLMYSGVFTAMAFAAFHLGSLREIPVHKVQLTSIEDPVKPHVVDIMDSIRLKGNNTLGSNSTFIGISNE